MPCGTWSWRLWRRSCSLAVCAGSWRWQSEQLSYKPLAKTTSSRKCAAGWASQDREPRPWNPPQLMSPSTTPSQVVQLAWRPWSHSSLFLSFLVHWRAHQLSLLSTLPDCRLAPAKWHHPGTPLNRTEKVELSCFTLFHTKLEMWVFPSPQVFSVSNYLQLLIQRRTRPAQLEKQVWDWN